MGGVGAGGFFWRQCFEELMVTLAYAPPTTHRSIFAVKANVGNELFDIVLDVSSSLGKTTSTRFDEFSENFRRGGGSFPILKIALRFFGK